MTAACRHNCALWSVILRNGINIVCNRNVCAKHERSKPCLEWLTCSGEGVSFCTLEAGVVAGLSVSSSSGRGSSLLLGGNPLEVLERGGVASSSSIISSVSSSPTPVDEVESAGDSCWNSGLDPCMTIWNFRTQSVELSSVCIFTEMSSFHLFMSEWSVW